MKEAQLQKRRRFAGFSIAESVVSLGIGAMAVVGGMTLQQHELRLVKSVKDSNSASHALEERIEQLRLVNWRQMTDAEHLIASYFPNRPASSKTLAGITERLSVTAYPDSSACTPLTIERRADGTTSIISNGAGLDQQRLARVNVRVSWNGTDSRVRVRELATIISNAGINMKSLPATGFDGSSGSSTGTGTTSTTTTTTSTGTTETTSSTTSTSSTTTTGSTTNTGSTTTTTSSTASTTSTTADSAGNGRGNAGGKPGKK